MSGSRTKKLKREAYPIWLALHKKHGRRIMPFKSIFRQVKKMYTMGLPIFQKKTLGMA